MRIRSGDRGDRAATQTIAAVLVRFTSITRPAAVGPIESPKQLHIRSPEAAEFIDIVVSRTQDPPSRRTRKPTRDSKTRAAFRRDEGIPPFSPCRRRSERLLS